MGDPKKPKKKYSTPSHPWQKERIEEEKLLLKEYGIRSKKELWKINSKLRNFLRQAKHLIALRTAQAEKEKAALISKLSRLGLTPQNSSLDDVLDLKLRNLLERRLQTRIVRKSFARTMSQARQFITHHHIMVGPKKITSPSFLVSIDNENTISFNASSSFSSMEHPERFDPEEEKKRQEIITKKDEAKHKHSEQTRGDNRFRGGPRQPRQRR